MISRSSAQQWVSTPAKRLRNREHLSPARLTTASHTRLGLGRLSCDPAVVQIDVHAAKADMASKYHETPPQINGAIGGTDFTPWTDDQLKARQPGGASRMIIDPPVCRLQYLRVSLQRAGVLGSAW
jgi:hypothetical protein